MKCTNYVKNIVRRKYDLGKSKRLKRVYTDPDRTQEQLKNVRKNVKFAKEMNFERRRESQVFQFTVRGKTEVLKTFAAVR